MQALDLARLIVDIISDKMGSDIVLMDIHETSIIADYFVICSAGTDRQLDAISDDVQKKLKEEGVYPLHVEGTPSSGWILLDYTDVIVHLFAPSQREFYKLEALWEDAKILLRVA